MGNEESKIADETHLPRAEIAWLHERYEVLTQRSITARGEAVLLTLPQFTSKFPESQHKLAKVLFEAMDVDRKGVVDFRHFCAAVTVLSRGTKAAKMDFAFRLYDRGDKGYIDATDMHDIATVFRASCRKIADSMAAKGERDGDDASPTDGFASPVDAAPELSREATTDLADSLLRSMDRQCTGRVSKEDFIEFCREHPDVIAQVEQTYAALRRAAMFDWAQPNGKGSDECVVA
jgi:Ca2+-binding EF-hand superfamily protein